MNAASQQLSHIQMHFACLIKYFVFRFRFRFHLSRPHGPHWQKVRINSAKGLAPDKCQFMIWINVEQWHMTSQGLLKCFWYFLKMKMSWKMKNKNYACRIISTICVWIWPVLISGKTNREWRKRQSKWVTCPVRTYSIRWWFYKACEVSFQLRCLSIP